MGLNLQILLIVEMIVLIYLFFYLLLIDLFFYSELSLPDVLL